VIIGRNEGERLRRCLESISGKAERAVYVDSGSTDGSVDLARSMGVEVVALDLSKPFTAARGRNAGFDRLLEIDPTIDLVQFVDGDCEVIEGWLEAGALAFEGRPDLAVVCGRRRERHPDASKYNLLCDIEWNTPVGEATACGGDSMMRVSAFREVGGFDPELIAGEEPELCLRLRRHGYAIERIDREMTLHDAAMTRFSQWWKRNVRSGYAYAEGAWSYGLDPERYRLRETARVLAWCVGLPLVMVGGALPSLGTSFFLSGAYAVSIARTWSRLRLRGFSEKEALYYAVFTAVGKLPELQGILRFVRGKIAGERSALIEYKR
jgi:GT2 family glycosyltransferase